MKKKWVLGLVGVIDKRKSFNKLGVVYVDEREMSILFKSWLTLGWVSGTSGDSLSVTMSP